MVEVVGSSPALPTIAVKAIDTIVSVALTFFYALKSCETRDFRITDAPITVGRPQYDVFITAATPLVLPEIRFNSFFDLAIVF